MANTLQQADDNSSMTTILQTGLQSILPQLSRKHSTIKQSIDTICTELQQKQTTELNDADQYFYVLKQACDTQVPAIQRIALDTIQKLIAYGYMNGSSIADNTLYPIKPRIGPSTPQNSNTDGNEQPTTPPAQPRSTQQRKLISVIIETLFECSQVKDATVQVQVIKALLTAVTSVNCQVHDHSLLHAVTSCYQIYLNAADEINKITAKGALTQIFNLVFQRMEHFAAQLQQLEAKQKTSVNTAATNTSSDASLASMTESQLHDNGLIELDSTLEDLQDIRSGTDPASATHSRQASLSTTNGVNNDNVSSVDNDSVEVAIDTTTHDTIKLSITPTLSRQNSMVVESLSGRGPRGRRAYCIECNKPANYYCIYTRDVVCSQQCMQANVEHNADRLKQSNATTPTSTRSKLLTKLAVLQHDAWHLLRKLCILGSKSHNKLSDQTSIDSKILSLQLLHSILDSAANWPTFTSHPEFVKLIKTDFISCLLKNSGSEIESIFTLSAQLFYLVILRFKSHLYSQIGAFIDSIYIPTFQSPNFTYQHKYTSLTLIHKICESQTLLVDLFLNYDCDTTSPFKTFEQICKSIEKMAKGNFGSPNDSWLTADESYKLQKLALNTLVQILNSMVIWTNNTKLLQQQNTNIDSNTDTKTQPSTPSTHSRAVSTINNTLSSTESVDDIATTENSTNSQQSTTTLQQSWSTQFVEQRQRKQLLETGIIKFNIKPKRGLRFLINNGFVSENPVEIATFFRSNSTLDKTAIGEFLGEDEPLNKQVMYAFTEQCNFKDMKFDTAIRVYLHDFLLPGEGQKIDRIMEKFAEQYVLHNPTVFNSADVAFILAYSVIMLNVDQHSSSVKNRMTKEQFVANNRGIDDGKDVDYAVLSELYDNIKNNEIIMKDEKDNDDTHNIYNTAIPAKKRASLFQLESQKMVKRTLDLIKRQPNNTSALHMPDNSAVDNVDKSVVDRLFYSATDSDILAIKFMFDDVWKTALATMSQQLEVTQDTEFIAQCLIGYKYAIRISNAFDIELSRTAFVLSLKKLTLLGSNTRDIQAKNIQAIEVLLQICISEGNYMHTLWYELLLAISEVDRLQLIYKSTQKSSIDVFNTVNTNNTDITPQSTTQQRDTANASTLHTIDSNTIDRVFTQSQTLDNDAIVDFVDALKRVSEYELQQQPPRVFSLQKIVEITYYNMSRIRYVWKNIWKVLSQFFCTAGCHNNVQISMYAIDSLKQLALKFFERDELSNYAFQAEFIKPFEYIISHTQNTNTAILIISMLDRMIQSRHHNIKSGWKGLFHVLSSAGTQSVLPVVNSGMEVVDMIMTKYFTYICDLDISTIGDCVNCLVAYGCNEYFTHVNIKAMSHLQTCANFLGEHQSFDTHTDVDVGNKQQTTVSNNSNNVNEQARLKAWFLVLTGLSRMVQDVRLDVRSVALTTLFTILHNNGTLFTSDTWRAIFHGVIFPIFDDIKHSRDAHIRLLSQVQQAQQQLKLSGIDLNNNNGSSVHVSPAQSPQPSPMQQRNKSSSPLQRKPPSNPSLTPANNRMSSRQSSGRHTQSPLPVSQPLYIDAGWLQTTCYTALSTLIELFHAYHNTIAFMLPEMLDLITCCIDQDSEDLARIGIKCLIELINRTGTLFNIAEWNIVIDSLNMTVKRTLPQILLSIKLRTMLGLPTNTATPAQQLTHSRSNSVASNLNESQTNGTDTVPKSPSVSSTQRTAGTVKLPFQSELLFAKCRTQLLLIDTIYDIVIKYFPRSIDTANTTKLHFKFDTSNQLSHTANKQRILQYEQDTTCIQYNYELQPKPIQSIELPANGTDTAQIHNEAHKAKQDSNHVQHNDNNDIVLGHLTHQQFYATIDILLISLSFARSFNNDLELRRRLYANGYVAPDTPTRLPQLFYQEARCIRLIIALLFKLYQNNVETQHITNGTTHNGTTHKSTDEAEIRLLQLSQRVLTEYMQKVIAGQLLALESMDDVLCGLIEHITQLHQTQFDRVIQPLYKPLMSLVEYGSVGIRHSLSNLLMNNIAQQLNINTQ